MKPATHRKAPTARTTNQFNLEPRAIIDNAETTISRMLANIMIKAMTIRAFKAFRRKRWVERFKVPFDSK
jgi:hypothetical protein